MAIETVYQTLQFEVVALNDPQMEEALESWGLPGALDDIPQDTLQRMQEENAYLILNKSNNSVGAIDPATLSLSFEEYHPSEGMQEIRKTFLEQIIEKGKALDALEETEDFYRGMNAFMDVLAAVQNESRGQ